MHLQNIYDPSAPKRPVNLSANSDLIRCAKEKDVNLSETFEEAVLVKLRARFQQDWLAANKDGIEAYNERIERNGVFAAKHRKF